MSAQGRPVMDTRSNAALEYVGTSTLAFVMISLLILLMLATLPWAARSLSTAEAGAAGRIANSDETHHRPSNEGERGGSRANT